MYTLCVCMYTLIVSIKNSGSSVLIIMKISFILYIKYKYN